MQVQQGGHHLGGCTGGVGGGTNWVHMCGGVQRYKVGVHAVGGGCTQAETYMGARPFVWCVSGGPSSVAVTGHSHPPAQLAARLAYPARAASSPPCLSCPPAPPTLHSLCSLGSDSTIAHHTSHVLQITCPEPSCCASMHTRCRASLRNTHPRHAAHVAQALRLRVHSHRNERGITHLPPTFSSRRCMLNRRTCSVTARRPPCAGLAAWGPS